MSVSRFDSAAAQWDNNPARVRLAQAVGAAICRVVPLRRSWRAVDYGAGTGLLTLNLEAELAGILALDSSAGMLDQLRQKVAAAGMGNVEIRQWDLEARPLAEAGFDLVFSSMTLHHLRDVPLVFRRFAEVLRPGGWLAVADLDAEDGTFHADMEGVFHKGFERSQIADWIARAGFGEVQLRDAHSLVKPSPAGEARTYSVFLATGQKQAG